MILQCDCEHAFQDETYGKGKRVHTPCVGGKARCTVCGKVKEGSKVDRAKRQTKKAKKRKG